MRDICTGCLPQARWLSHCLFCPLIGGVLTDICFWLIKKGDDPISLFQGGVLGGILNGSKPFSALLFFILLGLPAMRIISRHPFIAGSVLLCSILPGILAGALGAVIGKELHRIGLLN